MMRDMDSIFRRHMEQLTHMERELKKHGLMNDDNIILYGGRWYELHIIMNSFGYTDEQYEEMKKEVE